MATFYEMPAATPTMTVGMLAKWAIKEGASVIPQTIIASVETDKAAADIEIFEKTTFLKFLVGPGAEVPTGFPIAIIGNPGEDISILLHTYERMKAEAAAGAPPVAAPAPVAVAAPPPESAAPKAPSNPSGLDPENTRSVSLTGGGHPSAGLAKPIWHGKAVSESVMEPRGRYSSARPSPRIVASPLAKAIAAEKGVALSAIKGSGPDGRIVAEDVEKAAAAPAVSAVPAASARRADELVRVTQMRKTIARRLTEVHQQVPVFYLTVRYDATRLVALKEQAGAHGAKISYNDLFLKAVAKALREVPECNAAWQGDTIVRRGSVDIGVAVALPEGLITPVIRDADRKGVAEIAAEVRALAGRAKEGKLALEEYTGGTITVSNLGMFGIEKFTAILNAPEAAILAVGGVQQEPVVVDGALAVGWRMQVTMTCDHRVIDGALGARFLAALRVYVENPSLLVL